MSTDAAPRTIMAQQPAVETAAHPFITAWRHRLAGLGAPHVVAQQPTPIDAPYPVAFNPDVAALLDMEVRAGDAPGFAEVFAGNRVPAGAQPVAHRYAGHQFGVWAGQLGDGRAITLGEVRNSRGETWEVQLKGAGKTPFARFADGRAVLRSSIREYLASEAMAGLGVPTTRALAIVGSDAPVYRETAETAAVVTRVAPGLIRFGSFEWLFYADHTDELAPLADHVISEHFPQLAARTGEDRYRAWVERVIELTAELLAAWQAVGFCHGVMNTDNMSVLGLTLDYGPFAFMEAFQPDWAPNHTDTNGRYAYDQQPHVALWNLGRFVQAVLPLLGDTPEAAIEFGQQALEAYRGAYDAAWLRRMRAKLGLREARGGDRELIDALLGTMARQGADYTRVFRALGRVPAEPGLSAAPFTDEFADLDAAMGWIGQWRQRLAAEQETDSDVARARRMAATNPKYILRTHMAQYAIERAQTGDYSEIARLHALLRRPFHEQPQNEADAQPPAAQAKGVSLSCSS